MTGPIADEHPMHFPLTKGVLSPGMQMMYGMNMV
jgi:hypothetical protein